MVKKWKKYSTGLELVLCSCERELLCVLTDDEELVFSFVWALQDRASELLAPTLKQMFDLSGHSFSELRRIGCVRGPGSFTGIRLVLATAAALRRTTRAQLAALDYMQALATSLAMNEQLLFGRKIWIATHARRDLVHLAGYVSYGPVIPAICLEPVHLISPEGAYAPLQHQPSTLCACLGGTGTISRRMWSLSTSGPVTQWTICPSFRGVWGRTRTGRQPSSIAFCTARSATSTRKATQRNSTDTKHTAQRPARECLARACLLC